MDYSAIKTCEKCGAENPEIARFCGTCGNSLAEAPVGTQGAASEQPVPGGTAFSRPGQQGEGGAAAGDPHAPGAGLSHEGTPIPPPGSQQAAGGAHAAPLQAQPHYQQQSGYGYGMPSDGNTSGMGEGYPVPEDAKGWSFAGFVPFGLFSFVNGSSLWGAIGLIATFLQMYTIYSIIIGILGKEQAWRNRRFDSIQQYRDTMRVWSNWGLALLLLSVGLIFLYVMFIFAIVGTAFMSEM